MKNPKAIDLVAQAVPLVSALVQIIDDLKKAGVPSERLDKIKTPCGSWLTNASKLITKK